uniref:O-succinylhomoserine sulfhydrylase n=1 Tax=Arundo donax TaxID=35708 RepID=A0A0A9D9N3_ARUDO
MYMSPRSGPSSPAKRRRMVSGSITVNVADASMDMFTPPCSPNSCRAAASAAAGSDSRSRRRARGFSSAPPFSSPNPSLWNGRLRVTSSEAAAIAWAIGMGACVTEEQEIRLQGAARGREQEMVANL